MVKVDVHDLCHRVGIAGKGAESEPVNVDRIVQQIV